ncbi:hypothetical protein GQ457_11G018900 [Hibiscus cannabinus]
MSYIFNLYGSVYTAVMRFLSCRTAAMNSNNWLPFPTSPTISSLPTHLQYSQSHHFNLGLFGDSLDNPFHVQAVKQVQFPRLKISLEFRNPKVRLWSFKKMQQFALADLVNGRRQGHDRETSVENDSNMVETPAATTNVDTFGQRTSIYRGVTSKCRHRWTGRYEAHLWDNSCRRQGQSRKGRQAGGYDKEIKQPGLISCCTKVLGEHQPPLIFPISNYDKELEDMKNMTRQEFVAAIRRKSSGFSRGASMYRGTSSARQMASEDRKSCWHNDLYLGTSVSGHTKIHNISERKLLKLMTIAAIKFRGLNAVTNFEMSRYDVKNIVESNALPIGGGGAAKRLKEAQALESSRKREEIIALIVQLVFQYGNPSTVPVPEQSRLYADTVAMHQQPWSYDLHQSSPRLHPKQSGFGHGLMMNTGELGLVKVIMTCLPTTTAGSGDSVQCSNPGVFSMWMI